MNTAQTIMELMNGGDIVAATFEHGYAVHRDGRRAHFEQCRDVKVNRNAAGRCILHVGSYSDGSVLTMRYSEDRGYTYSAK